MNDVPTIDVVAAVVTDGDEILVCRRGPHIGQAGRWEFPGGKVEPGDESIPLADGLDTETPELLGCAVREDPIDALVREVQEELGVGIRVTGHLSTDDTHVGDRIIRLACYRAELEGDRPSESTDHDELRWVGAGDLDQFWWAEPDLPAVRILAAE